MNYPFSAYRIYSYVYLGNVINSCINLRKSDYELSESDIEKVKQDYEYVKSINEGKIDNSFLNFEFTHIDAYKNFLSDIENIDNGIHRKEKLLRHSR